MNYLKGYKTYLAAGALFVWGVYGLVSNHLTQDVAVQTIFEAMAIAGLRNALPTK